MSDAPALQTEPVPADAAPADLALVTEGSTLSAELRGTSPRMIVLQCLVILLGAAGFAWVLHPAVGPDHPHTNWILTTLLAIVSLTAGCWHAVRQWRDYTLPMRALRDKIAAARIGECPIEELSTVSGGLKPILPLVQQLLIDLRQERTRNAILEEEIRQRVLSRTESLERKIGSLKQQATRDALTGLSNRRLLDQVLPELVEASLAQWTDLTVMMIDVDYFKILNDTLGHAAGDALLKQIAQLIRSSIRDGDTAYRCGGDEFVVVMPNTSIELGREIANRLRSMVDGLAKTIKVSRPPRLSIGVDSLYRSNTKTAADLLSNADKALYDVKAARKAPSRVA